MPVKKNKVVRWTTLFLLLLSTFLTNVIEHSYGPPLRREKLCKVEAKSVAPKNISLSCANYIIFDEVSFEAKLMFKAWRNQNVTAYIEIISNNSAAQDSMQLSRILTRPPIFKQRCKVFTEVVCLCYYK